MTKPVPLLFRTEKPRRTCPVCGSPTYSREGIHPQCAHRQASAQQLKDRQAQEQPAAAPPKQVSALALKPWHKRCPECQAQVHFRKPACGCGHRFEPAD